jgi:hypothetical protein
LVQKYKKTKNTLIEAKQSEAVGWWISELGSLGTKKTSSYNNNNNNIIII